VTHLPSAVFSSDGRHDIQYYCFKDFEQKFDVNAKSRLAGMTGGLSIRIGAALRHAGLII
jgi:nitric oxide reductase NorD protein